MSGRFDTCPRFTVIIPAKDRADYLAHTLRTCTMQRYEPLEIIVSDDGSTDSTRAVVEEASRRDPRIRLIAHDRPIGMRDNFEFTLQQAKPGFVIMLGSDDGLLPDDLLEALGTVLPVESSHGPIQAEHARGLTRRTPSGGERRSRSHRASGKRARHTAHLRGTT